MKALSVRNPWALAIMLDIVGKDIENRDWPTGRREHIAIHASASMTRLEFDDAVAFMRQISKPFPYSFEQTRKFNGKILGTIEIFDCVRESSSPWFQGEFGFCLRNAVRFENPIAARGSLGFWDWTHSEASLEAQRRTA